MTDLAVRKIFGIGAVQGDLGVEIEVEGNNLPDYVGGYWRAVIDNSLRGGMEYVFDRPIGLYDADKAIVQLQNIFKEMKSKLAFTFRTSTHVHVNVSDMKYSSLLNMIYTYLILEGPMMEYCGDIRKNNRFCLRLQDAANFLTVLESVFRNFTEGRYKRIPVNMVRYASINLEALPKFGSLEFRGMRGTLDKNVILTWCSALLALRSFATSVQNPMQVYSLYMELGPEKFMQRVLGSYHKIFWNDQSAAQMDANFLECISLPFIYEQSLENAKVEKPVIKGVKADFIVREDDFGVRVGEDMAGRMAHLDEMLLQADVPIGALEAVRRPHVLAAGGAIKPVRRKVVPEAVLPDEAVNAIFGEENNE